MSFRRRYDWTGNEKNTAMVYLERSVRVRLTDRNKVPVANGRCRIVDHPETIYQLDEKGIANIPVTNSWQKELRLEWENKEAEVKLEEDRFCFRGTFYLDEVYDASDSACAVRLEHLGFYGNLAEQVTAFQSFFAQTPTGHLPDIRNVLVDWHDGGSPPAIGADTTNTSYQYTLPKVISSGWSVADVHEEAKKIDSDNNGKIDSKELDDFQKRARSIGMKDSDALAWYRKYETAAGLAEKQGETSGRQFTDAYLAGPYKRELSVVKADDDDIKQINRILFPQIHLELGPGALAGLRTDAGLSAIDREGVEAFYKHSGYSFAFVYDDNKNGVVDGQDFVVIDGRDSRRLNDLDADDINATAALIEFMRAYKSNKPQFMNQSNVPVDKWFPTKFWKWIPAQSKYSWGSWKYIGADAAKDLRDILSNTSNYAGDCGALNQFAAHLALSHQVGSDTYNRLVSKFGLYIGFSGAHSQEGLSKEVIWKDVIPMSITDSALRPNTMGYAIVASLKPPDSGSISDIQRRNEAFKTIKNSAYNGEHFLIWINSNGEKVVFAHPEGEIAVDKFEPWLKEEVADVGASVDYKLQASDVIIEYKPSRYYQAVKARNLLR